MPRVKYDEDGLRTSRTYTKKIRPRTSKNPEMWYYEHTFGLVVVGAREGDEIGTIGVIPLKAIQDYVRAMGGLG